MRKSSRSYSLPTSNSCVPPICVIPPAVVGVGQYFLPLFHGLQQYAALNSCSKSSLTWFSCRSGSECAPAASLVIRGRCSNHYMAAVMVMLATPPTIPLATALFVCQGAGTGYRHRRATHWGNEAVRKREDIAVENDLLGLVDCTELQ